MPAPSCRQQSLGGAAACWIDAFCHQTLATRLPTWYANAVTSLPLPPCGSSFVASCSHRGWPGRPAKTPLHAPKWRGCRPAAASGPSSGSASRPPLLCSSARKAGLQNVVGCMRGGVLFAGLGKWVAWRCGRFLGQSRSDQAQSARHEGVSRFSRTRKYPYA